MYLYDRQFIDELYGKYYNRKYMIENTPYTKSILIRKAKIHGKEKKGLIKRANILS